MTFLRLQYPQRPEQTVSGVRVNPREGRDSDVDPKKKRKKRR